MVVYLPELRTPHANVGAPVYATSDGIVVFAKDLKGG
jgi:murein DD-endopeptidase MepM/ murein hydrolase activator NlpD